MKTIFLGDTHGRALWKDIITKENPYRVVFIGDYFDSFDLGGAEQMHNFKEIIEFKEQAKDIEVILLVGNHDFHYYPGGETYSGYQHGASPAIKQLLEENKHHMQMCYQLDNILCTHAGIGHNWLVTQQGYTDEPIADFVNQIWQHRPNAFIFTGWDSYGDNTTQTPIWIRPGSLMSGNKETFLKKDYIQIVGHTQVRYIDMGKATGGRYYFIDVIPERQYLIYENQEFSLGEL
jgi:predicted phosphodiesterase